MRILVAGAGAIGQWLGARLQHAGHDVTLLVRERFKAPIEAGLTIHGHTTFEGPIPCITDVEQAESGFDIIFLTPKAHATAEIAKATAPLLVQNGVLASMQNGLGNGEKLLRVVSPAQAAVCLTSHGVTVEAPGRIHHAGTGPTKVGPVPGHEEDAGARRAEALLQDAGLDPEWCPQMRGPIWQKAIVNAAINPVGALYGVRNGEILERDDLHALSRDLAREAATLAERARVELPPGDPLEIVDTVLAATAANKCSMLQDVEAGRATEIEQITGRMVRLGELLLVSMPRSDFVYGRIKDLERDALGAEAAEGLAWAELPYLQDPF